MHCYGRPVQLQNLERKNVIALSVVVVNRFSKTLKQVFCVERYNTEESRSTIQCCYKHKDQLAIVLYFRICGNESLLYCLMNWAVGPMFYHSTVHIHLHIKLKILENTLHIKPKNLVFIKLPNYQSICIIPKNSIFKQTILVIYCKLLFSLFIEEWEDYIPEPPDGGWGWVVMIASFFNNFILDGISYCFGVFLYEYVNYFDSSISSTSLANSLLCGIYLLVGKPQHTTASALSAQ